ncbi:MAG: aldo/keto reductase [Bdellovibrio sp.]|nr:aldo/keto reductase [Bdellovibrio sp.]
MATKGKRLFSQFSPLPLGFGGGALSGEGGGYGFGPISDAEAQDLIRAAYESGVRLFDTAPIYGFGLSEKRLGEGLKALREEIFFVSKSGITWHDNKRVNLTNDPKVAKTMLEQTLRDLQTEYIDLYMVHWPDPQVDIRRPLEILSQAQHEGKIRHLGLCNTTAEDLTLAIRVAKIEAVQSELNLWNTEAHGGVEKMLTAHDISFMSWGTLDKGIITGTVKRKNQFHADDSRSRAPWWRWDVVEKKLSKMQQLQAIFNEYKISPLQFALAFNFSFENVDLVLVGPKSKAQLQTLLEGMRTYPTGETWRQIKSDLDAVMAGWSAV